MSTAHARALLVSGLSATHRGDCDLLDRFDRFGSDLVTAASEVYGPEVIPRLVELLLVNHKQRDESLRTRDRHRVLEPDWFQRPDAIGYVCYTDLFAGSLAGVADKIPYLTNLGVTYLHLMPVLKPRPGANDGGYAVMDYRALRPDLGTMADLRATAELLHEAGISLTLDLVLNHVAREHEWADKARSGDPKYRDYFHIYPDRDVPDAFEQTLPEVFPDFAPGNFSYDPDLAGWVWTTFNDYQWDVNWSNADVFCEFADIIANLANHGVDCLRLDAIAFIWKRQGTTCQNEPEVHAITQALRAFCRILAPSLIFKAEAIVGPAQVGAYLGTGPRAGKVSDVAYHNSLMVQIWSALAAKDARLLELSLSRFHALPTNTAWGTYVRCHDDIGWAIDDSDAHLAGLNGHDHRMFLADYYTGRFYGSDARGIDFMVDDVSGERRTSGSAAALAGIEAAHERADLTALATAIDRYMCGYAMVLGFGGIPLLYMGDEIAMPNDTSYVDDPAKAQDNRWIHRPAMDWPTALAAQRGDDPLSVPTQVRTRLSQLIAARRSLPSLHAAVATRVRAGRGPGVAIFERRHPAGDLVQVYNVSDTSRWVGADELAGLQGRLIDHIAGTTCDLGQGMSIAPYGALWLSQEA